MKLGEAFVEFKSRGLGNVTDSIRGLSSAFQSVAGNIGGLQSPIANLGQTFSGLTSTIGGTTAAIAGLSAVGVALAAVLGAKSVAAASKLEDALAEVSTLVDTSVVDMKEFQDGIVDMSTEVVKSSTDLTNGLYQVISAGVESGEALDVLRVAAKAASAGMTDTFTSVDLLTTVLNSYKLETSETEHVADLLFATIKEGKTRFNELAGSLGSILPIASDLNISLEELLGIMAHLTKGGLSTSEATTALRSALFEFIKPAENVNEVLGDQAALFTKNAVKSKGLVRALNDVADAAENNGHEIDELIGRQRANLAISRLVGDNMEDVEGTIRDVTGATGEMGEAFKKQMQTFSKQVKALKLEWERVKIEIGTKLLPILTKVLKVTRDIIKLFREIVETPVLFPSETEIDRQIKDFFRSVDKSIDKQLKGRVPTAEEALFAFPIKETEEFAEAVRLTDEEIKALYESLTAIETRGLIQNLAHAEVELAEAQDLRFISSEKLIRVMDKEEMSFQKLARTAEKWRQVQDKVTANYRDWKAAYEENIDLKAEAIALSREEYDAEQKRINIIKNSIVTTEEWGEEFSETARKVEQGMEYIRFGKKIEEEGKAAGITMRELEQSFEAAQRRMERYQKKMEDVELLDLEALRAPLSFSISDAIMQGWEDGWSNVDISKAIEAIVKTQLADILAEELLRKYEIRLEHISDAIERQDFEKLEREVKGFNKEIERFLKDIPDISIFKVKLEVEGTYKDAFMSLIKQAQIVQGYFKSFHNEFASGLESAIISGWSRGWDSVDFSEITKNLMRAHIAEAIVDEWMSGAVTDVINRVVVAARAENWEMMRSNMANLTDMIERLGKAIENIPELEEALGLTEEIEIPIPEIEEISISPLVESFAGQMESAIIKGWDSGWENVDFSVLTKGLLRAEVAEALISEWIEGPVQEALDAMGAAAQEGDWEAMKAHMRTVIELAKEFGLQIEEIPELEEVLGTEKAKEEMDTLKEKAQSLKEMFDSWLNLLPDWLRRIIERWINEWKTLKQTFENALSDAIILGWDKGWDNVDFAQITKSIMKAEVAKALVESFMKGPAALLLAKSKLAIGRKDWDVLGEAMKELTKLFEEFGDEIADIPALDELFGKIEEEEEKKKDEREQVTGGITIHHITGATRDIWMDMLAPLRQLNITFPAMLDELKKQTAIMLGQPVNGISGNGMVIEGPVEIHVQEITDLTMDQITQLLQEQIYHTKRQVGIA